MYPHSTPRNLRAIRRPNPLPRSANLPTLRLPPIHHRRLLLRRLIQLALFQPIHEQVQIEHHLRPLTHHYAPLPIQPLLLQLLQLRKETGHVDDAPTPDQVHAPRIHQPGRQQVEIVGDAIRDDGVPRVVAALGTRAQRCFRAEDVDEFSFAFVAPLGPEDDGRHRLRWLVSCRSLM